MELGLNKLPWYGQVIAFLVVSVAALAVFYFYYVSPARDDIAARRQELERLQLDINRALQTAKQLPEFEAEVANLGARLDSLRAVLPEQKDAAELLRRLQTLATQSNLTIRAYTPQAAVTRDLYAEWPIRLQLEGTYHNLGMFFDRVSKFSRIINISGVVIRGKEPPELNSTITAECTATTFVLRETPAAGAPAQKPGAAPAS